VTRGLDRRTFLGAAAGGIAAARVFGANAQSRVAERPNVLFILADDLGFGDLSCYGRPDYATPVLDRLASQGMKFTSAYAAAPVCTPTRCAFITGRYPQRFEVGLQEPLTLRSPEVGLPADQPTVASLLRAAGYRTALIGKWHLGWRAEFRPQRYGFDEFFGSLSGSIDYFTHIAADAARALGSAVLPDLWDGDTSIESSGYLTDLLTERAVEYVARSHTQPFYLS